MTNAVEADPFEPMVGIVSFEGDPPYELLVTKNGKATAAGGIVRLILPVSAPGPDPQERKIELLLRFGHASRLSAALRGAANDAQKNAQGDD